MNWSKSSLKLEGESGTMVLTPALSKETRTHVKDLEQIVQTHAKAIDKDLYLTMSIVNEGVKFNWGLVSDLDMDDMVEVLDD